MKQERPQDGVVVRTDLPGVPLLKRGKVRDVYDLQDHLLIVATDRISVFDVVLANGIPEKGKILTKLTSFWLKTLKIRNHLITDRVEEMPRILQPYAEQLAGRSMLVEKLHMLPVECVARGYLSGSAYAEYMKTGSICGIQLPAGLRESEFLPEPIFTPATKAETGHDENISFHRVVELLGQKKAEEVRDRTLEVYRTACEYARSRGIIIADTKFEWGVRPEGGPIVLADEVLTPDSSRFWDVHAYRPGTSQVALDKQYVRDYVLTLDWNRTPPGPELPPEVVAETARRYREIYERLTGETWSS